MKNFKPATFADNATWNEKNIEVSGKVLNFGKYQEHRTIQIEFKDLLAKCKTNIKDDGTFKTSILLPYPQDFYLEYGRLAHLFCTPGDSLFLEIDADIWKTKDKRSTNGKNFIQVTGGTAAKANQDLTRFLIELPNENYINDHAIHAVKNKSPVEYTDFIKTREKEYKDYLDKFNEANSPDTIFRIWAADSLKYESWRDVMRYAWENPYHNGIPRENLDLPDSYYSFLDSYDMDDSSLITMNHAKFLHELFLDAMRRCVTRGKGNGFEQAAYIDLFNTIKQNYSGFTQQLFLTNILYKLIKAHLFDLHKRLYKASQITNPYFLKRLESEFQNQKLLLANRSSIAATLKSPKCEITNSLIKQLFSNYIGKVIYIGFWAPWCRHCMQEMPASKEVQKYYNDKEVVFLFLANKTDDGTWKATIAKKELSGEHINLTDDQYNILASEFQVWGIPHYTLINRKGNIILKNAPRPSQNEILKAEIEKLLV